MSAFGKPTGKIQVSGGEQRGYRRRLWTRTIQEFQAFLESLDYVVDFIEDGTIYMTRSSDGRSAVLTPAPQPIKP